MKEKVLEWWDSLTSEKRATYTKTGVISIAIVVILGAYYASGQDEKNNTPVVVEEEIDNDTDLLEQDIRAEVDKDVGHVTERVDDVVNRLNALESLSKELEKTPPPQEAQRGSETEETAFFDFSDLTPDKPTAPPMPPSFPPAIPSEPIASIQIEPQIIGGIGHVEGEPEPAQTTKKKRTVRLPPSFMEAQLLTGIDALTTEGGVSNPETLFFRIQAPAVLPNQLKANLKGCFVIGNGFGHLAKERVQVRLVSLHCMSLDGQAVIDADVKGFVTDQDGKRDMAGNVVTRNSALIGRAFLAKAISGFGTSISNSSTQVATSPLGTTQVVDPDKSLKAGLGEGIKGGADQLEKIFVDYIKQVAPVIEVGTAKKVTVVIQEPVDLEIKETINDPLS